MARSRERRPPKAQSGSAQPDNAPSDAVPSDDPGIRPDLGVGASRAAVNPLEVACVTGLQSADPGCAYNFVRTFEHLDWVDFESLVQAGKTPEESGINDRFHKIEADLDALGDNVRRAFICLETLRAKLSICLNEIVSVLNAKERNRQKKRKTRRRRRIRRTTRRPRTARTTRRTKKPRSRRTPRKARRRKKTRIRATSRTRTPRKSSWARSRKKTTTTSEGS